MIKLLLVAFLLWAVPATAQEQSVPADMTERVKLAKDLHDIRQMRDVVNAQIEFASKGVPEAEREDFIKYMGLKLDFDALEAKSVKIMAEKFTATEMQAMIAYFGSPEGKSAEKKAKEYGAEMSTDIQQAIDAALMAVRIGEKPAARPEN